MASSRQREMTWRDVIGLVDENKYVERLHRGH